MPKTAQEVEDAVKAGSVMESPSLDAKLALPIARKNADIAKDVAAMATDGGVILYGVGEDEQENLTVLEPIELAGAADRVSAIVSGGLAEVPFIEPRALPLADDPSRGYLLVIVPQSERAPHMVVSGGENRYYGRDAKANRILNEGDVARLYERRARWAVDREQLLRDVIANAPVPPRPDIGYVHAFARPVAPDPGLLERFIFEVGPPRGTVVQWLMNQVHTTVLRDTYGPSLERSHYLRRHGADMWRWASLSPGEIEEAVAHATQTVNPPATRFDSTDLVSIDMNLDGRGQLFCGRASGFAQNATAPYVIEAVIAGNVEAFFTVMAAIYKAAGYHGAVDVGLAVTGIKGAFSERGSRGFGGGYPYPVENYTRHDRMAAAQLSDAPSVSYGLLRHLFETTTGIDGWDPWTQPANR